MNARKLIEPTFTIPDPWLREPWLLDLIDGCMSTVASVRFDATALPVDELRFLAGPIGVTLIVDMRVPDQEKACLDWIHIWRTLICPWDPIRSNGPAYLVRWMRETIANTLAHEVAESITVNGVRVFDQHRSLLP